MTQPHDPYAPQGQPSPGPPHQGWSTHPYGTPPHPYAQPSFGHPGDAPPGYGHPPTGPAPRPRAVDLAVKLMGVAAGLALLSIPLAFLQRGAMTEEYLEQMEAAGQPGSAGVAQAMIDIALAVTVVVALLVAGLWFLHARATGRGRNWARISGSVLGGLTLLTAPIAFVYGVAAGTSVPWYSHLLNALNLLLVVAVLVLIWQPRNQAFFAQR